MLDIESTLFNIKFDTMAPKTGSMLIAEPFLRDTYFNHSVIFLIDHGIDRHSMGLVMNHPTGYTLGQLIEGFDEKVSIPVHCGGPMSPERLFYVHRLGSLIGNSLEIGEGLWIGGDYSQIKQYIKEGYPTKGVVRFFIGYSGWDPGQLQSEINDNVWAVAPSLPSSEMLTDSGDPYWHKTVRSMGSQYRSWLLMPMYPSAN